MRLTMQERKKVMAIIAPQYQKARKKRKGEMLGEMVALTGYTRCYASYVLRIHGKKTAVRGNTFLVGDIRIKKKTTRLRIYDDLVKTALLKVWYIMDCICGKRLAPILEEIIEKLEGFKELRLQQATRQKLLGISSSTIDRLLAPERRKQQIKGRGNTKPGTLLKHQIPIRTFSEWNEQRPGFVEIDLVGHDGGDACGEYLYTLDVTDVCTGWTETQAVKNKAQVWVFEALKAIRRRLPFPLCGIDSDNGSEFINHHLVRYCIEEKLTFTRTRSYRKNDNCFVEQKNYSVVRRTVGYSRYDTEEEQRIINEIYGYTRLYTNFFLPVMKLIEKTRNGSKVTKRYDEPRTPYQRILESPEVQNQDKERLRKMYVLVNPAEMKRRITRLQDKLFAVSSRKAKLKGMRKEIQKKQIPDLGGYQNMRQTKKIACRASCEANASRSVRKIAAGGK